MQKKFFSVIVKRLISMIYFFKFPTRQGSRLDPSVELTDSGKFFEDVINYEFFLLLQTKNEFIKIL